MSILNYLKQFLLGRGTQHKQIQKYTPGQKETLDEQLSQGRGNVNFDALENRARDQFNQQTIPGLAERFTSMGGGQRSSSFQGALGRAGSDLESQLAGLRHGGGMQQLQMGLRPQFDTMNIPKSPGFLQQMSGPMGNIIGSSASPDTWSADPNSMGQIIKMITMILGGV